MTLTGSKAGVQASARDTELELLKRDISVVIPNLPRATLLHGLEELSPRETTDVLANLGSASPLNLIRQV